MILLNINETIYKISSEYIITPNDSFLNEVIKNILQNYSNPSQGFKTSFLAEELTKKGYNVVDVYDEELEESPADRVF